MSERTEAPPDLESAVNLLVDEYRSRCLWFMREDYYPSTPKERLVVLDYVERYGDAQGYRRAAELRRCLSQHSNEASVAS